MGPAAGLTRDTDPIGRVRKCGWVRLAYNVAMERERDGGRCRYGGLLVCGSIHCCPVCSANIRHQRMLEIERAALDWIAQGGSLVMVTLTTRHYAGMPLDLLWSAVSKGWDAARGGGRARAREVERWGQVGFIKAVEVTHGANGWHPHVHALMFVKGDAAAIAQELEDAWFPRWADRCARVTGARPTRRRGIEAVPVYGSEVGQYLAKVQDGFDSWSPAHELARGDLKRSRGEHGRTPFGLLDDYVRDHDLRSLAAWREWEASSKGRRAIEWSRASKFGPSLRDLLGIEDQGDQHAAERAAWETDPLYLFTPDEWDVVIAAEADFDLIVAAEQDGTHGVVEQLRALFGFDVTGEALACLDCEWNGDGLRTRSCDDCARRLRAISGRAG